MLQKVSSSGHGETAKQGPRNADEKPGRLNERGLQNGAAPFAGLGQQAVVLFDFL